MSDDEDNDDDEMGLMEALYEALADVETTGMFATGRRMEGCPLPGLIVEGVGPIALPLQLDQSRSIVEHSCQAPFGRGADTVVDTSVRLCRQVEPSKIQVSDAWDAYVQRVAREHAALLGVGGTGVEARLYKLVLYEEGGFFKSHKDTEKEPGMFGSLVVQLPARHDVGTLAVRHRGEEELFNFGGDGSDAYFYSVAFYADCEHELKPVENGKRLCLLYNLVRGKGGGPTSSLAQRDAICDQLARIASRWELDSDASRKLCLKLDHEYTKKNLTFSNLKGADKARADALLRSKAFDLHLALLERHKSGSAECDYYGGGYNRSYRRSYYDDDSEDDGYHNDGGHHGMEECYEDTTGVIKWINAQDSEVTLRGLKINQDKEMLGDEALFDSDAEPDREDYESYTGNAGPTVDYFYERAVLVIWPRSFSVQIVCDSSFESAVQLVQQRATTKGDDAVATLREVISYATKNLRVAHAHLAPLLKVACSMKQTDAVLAILPLLHCCGCNTEQTCEALLAAINLLGWEKTNTHVLATVTATPSRVLQHAATLALKLVRIGDRLKEAAAAVACEVGKKFVGEQRLSSTGAAEVAQMLFYFSDCIELCAAFVSRATELSTASLAAVLGAIYSSHRSQTMPEGFSRLASTYCSCVFFDYHRTAANSKDHVVRVFTILLNVEDDALQGDFVRAVITTNNADLLQAITKSSRAKTQNVHVRSLAAARARQLRYPRPTPSDQQRHADVPGHPQVTSFLRSDRTTMTYSCFNDINHARNFARKHFWSYNPVESHSARADAGGRGKSAYVTITKTKEIYTAQLAQYNRDQAELNTLQPLLDDSGQQESKRQRMNSDVIVIE
jgi:hypothetical protein